MRSIRPSLRAFALVPLAALILACAGAGASVDGDSQLAPVDVIRLQVVEVGDTSPFHPFHNENFSC